MQQNRHIPRWETNLTAYINLGEDKTPIACKIKDINLKGLQIILNKGLKINELLKLKIILLDKIILNAHAKVAWHKTIDKANVYGLSFIKISGTDREKISRIILENFQPEMSKVWWKNL